MPFPCAAMSMGRRGTGLTSIRNPHKIRFMRTDIDTNTISEGRRLTYWRKAVCANLVGVECVANPRSGLAGRFTQLATETGFAIARLRAGAHQAVRESSVLKKSGTDFYMLFLQKSGEMNVQRDGRSFTVRPGDMYFYDGSTEHSLTFESAFDHLAVRVPRSLIEEQCSALAQVGSFHLSASDDAIDQVLLPMTGSALGARNASNLPAIVNSVFELFSARSFNDSSALVGTTPHSRLTLARAIRKIESSLYDPCLNAESVAEDLGMSRRNLDRLIASCGTSFPQVLMETRLKRAGEMLAQRAHGGRSVTEIALAVGFENHSFFSRKFKERFDVSPRDYRTSIEQSGVHPST